RAMRALRQEVAPIGGIDPADIEREICRARRWRPFAERASDGIHRDCRLTQFTDTVIVRASGSDERKRRDCQTERDLRKSPSYKHMRVLPRTRLKVSTHRRAYSQRSTRRYGDAWPWYVTFVSRSATMLWPN